MLMNRNHVIAYQKLFKTVLIRFKEVLPLHFTETIYQNDCIVSIGLINKGAKPRISFSYTKFLSKTRISGQK